MKTELKPLAQLSDSDIALRILSGEAELYEIIMRRYNKALYSIGRSYGYNHEDTEDLMQETYISGYSRLSTFEGRASLKTWLMKIMLNHCYHKRSKFSFLKEIPNEFFVSDDTIPMFQYHTDNADKTTIRRELSNIIETALLKIPEQYSLVFTVRELNGLSVAQAAEVLGISENNVKVRLNRAKNLLKNEIAKLYSPEDIFEFNLIYCDRIVEVVMKHITSSI